MREARRTLDTARFSLSAKHTGLSTLPTPMRIAFVSWIRVGSCGPSQADALTRPRAVSVTRRWQRVTTPLHGEAAVSPSIFQCL